MKKIKGDLVLRAINGDFNMIIHGCNCFNTMGAGIAKQIKQYFPLAYRADQDTQKGDKSKLGDFSWVIEHDVIVINAYTQYHYGHGKCHADYNAIRSVFQKIFRLASQLPCIRIGYPCIGAGHAGGNWDIISTIIDSELSGTDHTLVYL